MLTARTVAKLYWVFRKPPKPSGSSARNWTAIPVAFRDRFILAA